MNLKYSKITNEQLNFLIDIGVIKFSNDGLAEVFNKLTEIVTQNKISSMISELNISAETIEFHKFEKLYLDKKDYAALTEDMKQEYKDFWLNRLIFFANIDYMWNNETFEPLNIIIPENGYVTEKSNIEVLGSVIRNNIYLNKELIDKTPLLINEEIDIDITKMEKFNNVKYKMPIKNIELISIERDKNYYIRNIQKISDQMMLASILDDLIQMDDKLFAEILLSEVCSEEEISSSNPIELLIKNIHFKNNWITSKSGTSGIYTNVLGYDLGYKNDLSDEVLNIIHKFNIKINTILFNEFNKTNDKTLEKEVFGSMKFLMDTLILLPEISFNIDPIISKELNESSLIKKMNHLQINLDGDTVKINTKDEFSEFKKLISKTIPNISSKYLFELFNNLRDDFTFNSKAVSDTSIAFGMYRLCKEYGMKINDTTKVIHNKLLLKLLENRNSINTECQTINHFILGEKITEIDKMSIEQKLMLCSTIEGNSNLLVKLLHDDFKNNFKIKDINIYINSFYEEERNIKRKTILKARTIIKTLINEKLFVAKEFSKLLGVEKNNDYIKEYERNFYKNILKEVEIFEYMRFDTPDDIRDYYLFKDLVISKDVESYKYKGMDDYVNVNILSCMLVNDLSEDYIEKFINNKEKRYLEKIDPKYCFQYFKNKNKIKFNELERFYYDSYGYHDTDKDKVNRLEDILVINDNPVFKLIKIKYKEKTNRWMADLYNNGDWIGKTDEAERISLITKLHNANLIDGAVLDLIISKEESSLIKMKCLCFLFDNYYPNENYIIKICNNDNFKFFTKEQNEKIFLEKLNRNISYMREIDINNILSLVENKERVFLSILTGFNNKNQLGFKLKDINDEFLNPNNKRLFKKIIVALNNEVLNVNKNNKDNDIYITSLLTKTMFVSEFFNQTFRTEGVLIDLIVNLSKVTQKEFDKNGSINDDLKKELVSTYVLLPSELSKLAVDKLNEGKLFHVVFSELNLINKINDSESVVRKKKKI